MSIPDFLKKKFEQNKSTKRKAHNKGDFREKCLELLSQIKDINEHKYAELSKIFNTRYDKINIQKTRLLFSVQK